MQHWFELRSHAEIDLYEGITGQTYDHVESRLGALRRSLLTRVQFIRFELRWLQGRLALSTATGSNTASRSRIAERLARQLCRVPSPYIRIWGELLSAGIAAHRGHDEKALEHLRTVFSTTESHEMLLCAAVARRRYGELVGGDEGKQAIDEADRAITDLGIRRPDRICAIFAPGFTRSL